MLSLSFFWGGNLEKSEITSVLFGNSPVSPKHNQTWVALQKLFPVSFISFLLKLQDVPLVASPSAQSISLGSL